MKRKSLVLAGAVLLLMLAGECGGSFSPYWLTELTDRTDVGIRPMMWVNAE